MTASGWTAILPVLRRLDRRLAARVSTMRAEWPPDAAVDPFRGLYISEQDVERSLSALSAFDPAPPPIHELADAGVFDDVPAFEELRQRFSLSTFDLDVIAIALAPELDLRYERIFAYLQNDVSRRRPSVDLALTLLCGSPEERLARRVHFLADGPLVSHGLIQVLPDPTHLEPPLLAHVLTLDAHTVSWMLGQAQSPVRSNTTRGLHRLASKVERRRGWDDLVLPSDTMTHLRELCDQATHRHTVYTEWGFERRLSLGRNLTALFSGSPGTGKTMAAEVIASALSLDLFRIDLSQVVSKYIGETEKHLHEIFAEAERTAAVLLFDEADALFGKRSQVKDAHDRYANIEVSYLLQRLEAFDGVAILATNRRANLDEAFLRRLTFCIEFPFPSEADRHRLWCRHLHADAPIAADVDLEFLAARIALSGGHIRNIVMSAAFLAAAARAPIAMTHLVHATRREFQKLGRACLESEFGPYFPLVQS